MTVANLSNEFGPCFQVKCTPGNRYMIWYDYAVIKLKHFLNNMSNFQANKTDIYPWAYYMINFGNDFSILKFEENKHTWVMK
jgi:hypothetical protein